MRQQVCVSVCVCQSSSSPVVETACGVSLTFYVFILCVETRRVRNQIKTRNPCEVLRSFVECIRTNTLCWCHLIGYSICRAHTRRTNTRFNSLANSKHYLAACNTFAYARFRSICVCVCVCVNEWDPQPAMNAWRSDGKKK